MASGGILDELFPHQHVADIRREIMPDSTVSSEHVSMFLIQISHDPRNEQMAQI